VGDLINKVLEEIRIISNNVLVFSKSFPLVEDPNFQAVSDKGFMETLFFGTPQANRSRRNTITSGSFVP
jgi:hypothetical protein